MKKFSFLWAILLVLSAAMVSCSEKSDVGPTYPINPPPPETQDSIVIVVNIVVPENVYVGNLAAGFANESLPTGAWAAYITDPSPKTTIVVTGETVKIVAGKTSYISAGIEGSVNGNPVSLDPIDENIPAVLEVGKVTEVTIRFKFRN